jgi:rod shape determining protein RodA
MNIGMDIGDMPVIGVPLPFVSQGGTAVLSMYIAIGMAMSVHSHNEKHDALFY